MSQLRRPESTIELDHRREGQAVLRPSRRRSSRCSSTRACRTARRSPSAARATPCRRPNRHPPAVRERRVHTQPQRPLGVARAYQNRQT